MRGSEGHNDGEHVEREQERKCISIGKGDRAVTTGLEGAVGIHHSAEGS